MNFKSLDFFRKLPKDMDNSTVLGGVFSILAITIGVLLFLSELQLFREEEIKKEMIIDQDFSSQDIRINIDYTFYNAPCFLITICLENDMGHSFSDDKTYQKIRIDSNGEIINEKVYFSIILKFLQTFANDNPSFHELISAGKKAIDEKEGCRVYGYLDVKKIPGNFHISFHQSKGIYDNLMSEQQYLEKLNLNYKVNEVSFGENVLSTLQETFKRLEINQNATKISNDVHISEEKKNFNHFIKIVPLKYINKKKNINFYTYQFSVNVREPVIENYQMPALYMNYELSPITTVYTVKQNSFLHFLVQVCAIIGGIIAVLGIVNSLTQESYQMIKKKFK